MKGLCPNLPFEPTIAGQKRLHRRCEHWGSRTFPKGKVQASAKKGSRDRSRDQSHQFWERSPRLRTKLSVSRSVLIRFAQKLAGSSGRAILHRPGIFHIFFCTFFWSHFSNPLINQCLCKVIKKCFPNMGSGTTRRPIPHLERV